MTGAPLPIGIREECGPASDAMESANAAAAETGNRCCGVSGFFSFAVISDCLALADAAANGAGVCLLHQ
jgi:hypothetical protein